MILIKMHRAVERDLSASRNGERTWFARLKWMMAGKMPPQRIFAAEVTQSLVQRQSRFADAMEALVWFAPQREEVAGLRLAFG